MTEKVTVGDLNSHEMGTGARKSEGKPDYALIYSPFLKNVIQPQAESIAEMVEDLLDALGQFQTHAKRTDIEYAYNTAINLLEETVAEYTYSELDSAVRVWELGSEKYNAFNWMKGMAWSVCIGCIHRHLMKQFVMSELMDDESGQPHLAHVVCNIQMLLFYLDFYPEGNDLPQSVVNFPEEETFEEAPRRFGETPIGDHNPLPPQTLDLEDLINKPTVEFTNTSEEAQNILLQRGNNIEQT